MEMLKEWAENYQKVLKGELHGEGVAAALGAFKVTDAYVGALPKAQQKVLRLRYLEGASWDGIGMLLGMDARWAKWKAAEGIDNLMRLMDFKEEYETSKKALSTRRAHEEPEKTGNPA